MELADYPDVSIDAAYDSLHPMVRGDESQIAHIRELLAEYRVFLKEDTVPVPAKTPDKN